MSCKYDIIDEGGRKRVRALRHFTVQGRDVCPMELGGYVYDANTLSQDGNCWIFSGSLEYPGVRVMDEAIVDMGNNLGAAVAARPKSTIISGNSRIMGAISFESQSFDTVQTPAMFEQGSYKTEAGNVPIKITGSTRVRISVPIFAGTVGSVAITNTAYKARLISLNEAGIVTSATAWTVGGPAVTLTTFAPYILVEVCKVDDAAIAPADVTAAGVTITQARVADVTVFNSSIVPVYNGAVTNVANSLRISASEVASVSVNARVNFQNSYIRVECTFNAANTVRVNADFIKVNYNLVLTAGTYSYISGVFRNTNINTPASVSGVVYLKRLFDVSDCPNFEYSAVTFPDLTAMMASGKTFYFKQCNMPVGSAIHYYDAKVNVWDNIDFTKAMADLGRSPSKNSTISLVSSNVQGMYRLYSSSGKAFLALVEAYASVVNWNIGSLSGYESVVYKDCTITGLFTLRGCNVFGGTLGGASKITNTTGTAMVIDGNFRIEGNAQVTDTPLKGNGYIGGNAELKNGNVEGYIYMQDNAKYIPAAVENPPLLTRLIMRGKSQILKHRNAASNRINIEMYDNAVIDSWIQAESGLLIMRGNASTYRADTSLALIVRGILEMADNARLVGSLVVQGDVKLVGNFLLASGSQTITGKRVISDVSQIAVADVPPTKTTW